MELNHVGYNVGAPSIQEPLGGQVSAAINPIGEIMPHANAGKLWVIVISGPTRSRLLSDVPTFIDAGYEDVLVQSWLGFFAPPRTPPQAVARLSAALAEAMKKPAVVEGFGRFSSKATYFDTARLTAALPADPERWGPIVRASGFKAE